ncbi:MAG: hypothetical protein QM779_15235 [Propionicimonas sp.]|uniref:hypothetical protein n=1 Tax=Propionicimonas sp. TaxID=1955623 RepID=UPI003D0A0A31
MNELEDRLRAELQTATRDIDSDLDPEALLSVGRRVRRNRTTRRVTASVAAVLAVGVIGWFGVGSVVGRGQQPAVVVATPSPIPPSATAPIPTARASSVAPSPGSAQAELPMGASFNGEPAAFDKVEIVATSDGTTITTRFQATNDGEKVAEATVTRKLDEARAELVRLGSHGVVAVVPGEVKGQSLYGPDTSQGGSAALDPLGATALVFLTEHAVGSKDPELVWEDGNGVLQSTVGVVASASVDLGGEEVTVFRSEALDSQGVWGDWSTAVKGAKPSDMLQGSIARSRGPGQAKWRLTQLGMLEPGSTDVAVTLSSADGDWAQAALPDGWIVVVAVLNSDDDSVDPVTSLAYTDAKGVRHTYPAK